MLEPPYICAIIWNDSETFRTVDADFDSVDVNFDVAKKIVVKSYNIDGQLK